MEQKTTIGRIVHYKPTEGERKTMEFSDPHVNVSELLPAVIVAVWSDDCVNLQVFLDGKGTIWVTSSNKGDDPGNWDWPLKK